MNRDINDYLVPLQLAGGSLPMGRLLYHATGQIPDGGTPPDDIQADLEALGEAGYIRIEHQHNRLHRRVEKTVFLTQAGRGAGARVMDAKRYVDFAQKEAGMDELDGETP